MHLGVEPSFAKLTVVFSPSCITVIDGIIVVIDALKTIFTGHKVHEHL